MQNADIAHDGAKNDLESIATTASNRTATEFLASLNVDIIPLGGVRETTKGFDFVGINDGVTSEYKEEDS